LAGLEIFHATAIHSDSGPLALTETSLFGLKRACPSLQRVGNLARWTIEDMEAVMAELLHCHKWKRVLTAS
jgi:hypothetical protein